MGSRRHPLLTGCGKGHRLDSAAEENCLTSMCLRDLACKVGIMAPTFMNFFFFCSQKENFIWKIGGKVGKDLVLADGGVHTGAGVQTGKGGRPAFKDQLVVGSG